MNENTNALHTNGTNGTNGINGINGTNSANSANSAKNSTPGQRIWSLPTTYRPTMLMPMPILQRCSHASQARSLKSKP